MLTLSICTGDMHWRSTTYHEEHIMAYTRRFTAWSIGLLAVGLGIVVVWGLPLQFATARPADLQTQVKELTDRVQELEAKLACMTKDGDEVIFDKCNVHIRSGSGKTDSAVNG